MRKNLLQFQVAENRVNLGDRFLLTSNGISPNIAGNQTFMETTVQTANGTQKKKQSVPYPLRFRSKAQKERLEKAAKKSGKTLRDFLLDHAEKAAVEQIAS